MSANNTVTWRLSPDCTGGTERDGIFSVIPEIPLWIKLAGGIAVKFFDPDYHGAVETAPA
jgi:hypothetical protein